MEQNLEIVSGSIKTLEEKLAKSDNVTQGTHENRDSVHDDHPLINMHVIRGIN